MHTVYPSVSNDEPSQTASQCIPPSVSGNRLPAVEIPALSNRVSHSTLETQGDGLADECVDTDVSDGGERVVPGEENLGYNAHLSIYQFAQPLAYGRSVLDAGCGTGYGSSYLIDAGARSVWGVDISEKAIRYSRQQYGDVRLPGSQSRGQHVRRRELRYDCMNLERLRFPLRTSFELVFSSNALEHITGVDCFLTQVLDLLPDHGVFVLAIPPIISAGSLDGNLLNKYHINNLTPSNWVAKLSRFFHFVQGYRHWIEPEHVGADGSMRTVPVIPAHHFTFTPRTPDEMMNECVTMTTVFVAREPRVNPLPPGPLETAMPAEWRGEEMRRMRRTPNGITGLIHSSLVVEQTFRCNIPRLRQIDLFIGTSRRCNKSRLELTLRQGSPQGRVLVQRTVNAETIGDNTWFPLKFDPIAESQDQPMVLEITSFDRDPNQAVCIYLSEETIFPDESLLIGQMRSERSLMFRLWN